MEPVVMAGTLLLLVAVAMLPFVLVVGLMLSALRSVVDAKPWLHDEVPGEDAWAATDRRSHEQGRAGGVPVAGRPATDDVPLRGMGLRVLGASPA